MKMHVTPSFFLGLLVAASSTHASAGPNSVVQPTLGQVFNLSPSHIEAAGGLTIRWTPTTQGPVNLILRRGGASNLNVVGTIATGVENTGEFVWTPTTADPNESSDKNLGSSSSKNVKKIFAPFMKSVQTNTDYTVEIQDASDISNTNFSPYFTILMHDEVKDVVVSTVTSSISATVRTITRSRSSRATASVTDTAAAAQETVTSFLSDAASSLSTVTDVISGSAEASTTDSMSVETSTMEMSSEDTSSADSTVTETVSSTTESESGAGSTTVTTTTHGSSGTTGTTGTASSTSGFIRPSGTSTTTLSTETANSANCVSNSNVLSWLSFVNDNLSNNNLVGAAVVAIAAVGLI